MTIPRLPDDHPLSDHSVSGDPCDPWRERQKVTIGGQTFHCVVTAGQAGSRWAVGEVYCGDQRTVVWLSEVIGA